MSSKIKLLNANGKTLTIENGDTSNSDINVRYFKTVSDLTTATGINGGTAILTDVDKHGLFIHNGASFVRAPIVLQSATKLWKLSITDGGMISAVEVL
jgi:hypothetical protein